MKSEHHIPVTIEWDVSPKSPFPHRLVWPDGTTMIVAESVLSQLYGIERPTPSYQVMCVSSGNDVIPDFDCWAVVKWLDPTNHQEYEVVAVTLTKDEADTIRDTLRRLGTESFPERKD